MQQVPRASGAHDLPLSLTQEGAWKLSLRATQNHAHSQLAAIRFKGELDIEAVGRCLKRIAQRHEILRAKFEAKGEHPMQIICEELSPCFDAVDLAGLSTADQEEELRRRSSEESLKPFDLAKPPLIRITLLKISSSQHVMLLTMHSIISDEQSFRIFAREFGELYAASTTGQPPSLTELTIQYSDFAARQRQRLLEDGSQSHLNYWKERLTDLPVLELPDDRPPAAGADFRKASLPLRLPKALSDSVKAMSQQRGAQVTTTLLAALQCLLFRYSGQDDVLLGMMSAGRDCSGSENLIGPFASALPVRTDLSGDPTFNDLMTRTQQAADDTCAHQNAPVQGLIEQLQPEGGGVHSSPFKVIFDWQGPPFNLSWPGLEVTSIDIHSEPARSDISLKLAETPDGLSGHALYRSHLFDPSTIARMLSHYENLLLAAVSDPEQRLSDLGLLSDSERHQLLVEWNCTASGFTNYKCIHHLIEAQVKLTPDRLAVVCGDNAITYGGLNARANQLAHYLRSLGVGPDVPVGICIDRSEDMAVGILAILKAGGAYVPIDPDYPLERLESILEDAKTPVLLTQRLYAERLAGSKAKMVCADAYQEFARFSDTNPESGVSPENIVYILYTSGSTGKPKGAIVEHRQLVNYYKAIVERLKIPPGISFPMAQPLTFDSCKTAIFSSLCLGGCLQMIPKQSSLDAQALSDCFRDRPADFFKITASHLSALLESGSHQDLLHRRWLVMGGEPILREWAQRIKAMAPECRMFNHYGLTETAVGSLIYPLDNLKGQGTSIVPLGRPLANVQVYVSEGNWQPAPVGVLGELRIGGDGLGRGYLNRADLTAERFVPNPFSEQPGARLYRTGDHARWLADGNIEFLRRTDLQIKIRGFRIEIGEIEAALVQHPAVRKAVVLAREFAPGQKRLVAYAVPDRDRELSESELRSYLEGKLPEYMVPSAFVLLEDLPRTAHGKVDFKALPAPDQKRAEDEQEYQRPLTQVEEILSDIWADLLRVEKFGAEDDFFRLGGDSLLITRMLSRIRSVFQSELSLESILESPTIRKLAVKIEQSLGAGADGQAVRIERAPQSEYLPLSYSQERMWLAAQLDPGSAGWNTPMTLHIKGPLNTEALVLTLSEVVRRHGCLRTVYGLYDGKPVQRISPHEGVRFSTVDLRGLPEATREAEALRLAQLEVERPFDLSKGPLLRLRRLLMTEEDQYLLITISHIAADEWSRTVLENEVMSLYKALVEGNPSPLPELEIQYCDFAYSQRQWIERGLLDNQRSYWRRRLAAAPPPLLLAGQKLRATTSLEGANHYFVLPPAVAQPLKALSSEAAATLFMTLLAAFKIFIYRMTGQSDIAVGTNVANRNRPGTEALIGFFVNVLVLRTHLSGGMSFRQALREVRKTALEAYAHEDLPFSEAIKELPRERALVPLFNVLFLTDNTMAPPFKLPGISVSSMSTDKGVAVRDLTLLIRPLTDGLLCTWNYKADLFDQPAVERWAHDFKALIERLVAHPDLPIGEMDLLSAEERGRQAQERLQRERSAFARFKAVKRKAVEINQADES